MNQAATVTPLDTPPIDTNMLVRRKAWQLLKALQNEASNHGGLRTQESLRLENELRLELSR